jgi:uncharacterized membrane protein YqjE
MVQSGTPQHTGSDQSLGDLVALALKDVTQLVRCEVNLAKIELRADLRRVAVAGILIGVAAFVGCLVLVLVCFAFAYGLMALGIWAWASFLIVAGTCVVLAILAVVIGAMKFRGLSGLRRTRESVQEGFAMLRRDSDQPAVTAASAE